MELPEGWTTEAQIIVASCSRRSLEIEQIKLILKGNGYPLSTEDWATGSRWPVRSGWN